MIIDKMDYIFAIAKEQNLTRAAKRLFVAQSTLTMYLNRVEAELGIKLFDRSRNPILPTQAGLLCIEELKKIQHIQTRMRNNRHVAAVCYNKKVENLCKISSSAKSYL